MRKEKPTGREIAERSKAIKLDKDRFVDAEKKGKKIKFTPTKLPPLKSLDELEEGQVIGVLENELEGDETDLTAGKHNIFIANVNGEWHGFAETGGKITAEAAYVSIERYHWGERKVKKPAFKLEGWCLINICLVSLGPFCLVSIGFICF